LLKLLTFYNIRDEKYCGDHSVGQGQEFSRL